MSGSMQFVWMIVESFLLGVALCSLVKARRWVGLTPIVVTIGALQFLQVVLALGVYVEVMPGYLLSPGSAVLFPATLFGFLLLYILEDAEGVRRFIYGLFVANVVVGGLTLAVSLHMSGPAARAILDLPPALFLRDPGALIVATVTLLVDSILVILAYEALAVTHRLFLRVWIALAGVLAFDTLAFVSASFSDHRQFAGMVVAGLVGKTITAAAYAAAVVVCGSELAEWKTLPRDSIANVLDRLTFRESHRTPNDEALRDPVTGLFNSIPFHDELSRAIVGGRVSVVVLDLDHFRTVNSLFGVAFGDIVLERSGKAIRDELSSKETAFRLGSDKFVVLSPRATKSDAEEARVRVQAAFDTAWTAQPLIEGLLVEAMTATATAPDEAGTVRELMKLAFDRIRAKKALRDDAQEDM